MRSARRRGYTLLEVFLVLVIIGVLIAAIASALNIHLRITESGRTEVEQAQLARALLGRIAGDLRGAVPHIEPVPSIAGATSDEIAAAAATAASGIAGTDLPSGGASGSTGGGSSSGGASGSSAGASAGSSGGAGIQTLQPLKTLGTLSTLKPQSASSSSSSAGSSSGAAGGSSGGTSASKSSSSGGSSSGGSSGGGTSESESSSEASATTKPPGIYGDQLTLQIDVSRLPRGGATTSTAAGGIALDAPGDVKTIGYYLAPITDAADASGLPLMGLFRQSYDKSAANYGGVTTEPPQLLASEVAAIEFRYFDGTAWQISWDSSASGALPTAVEVLITLNPPQSAAVSSSPTLTLPQVYRLTVAIPAAQVSGTATDASSETGESSSTSSSSGTTP